MWFYILSKGVFSGASRWHIVGAHQILDVLNGAGECLWRGGGSHSPAGDPPADAGWQPSELPRTTPVTGLSPRPRAGAGLVPWPQRCALESAGGRRPGELPALYLGWDLSLPHLLAPLPQLSDCWVAEPAQAPSSLLGSPAAVFPPWA